MLQTLGILIVLGACLHLTHTVQVHRQSMALLAQGLQAEKAGLLDRAALYLNTYLAYRPEDTDALAQYGFLLERLADKPRDRFRAFQVLEQVLRRNPQRRDVREKVVALAVRLDRYPEAARHLEMLRPGAEDPADVLQALAWAYLGAREYPKAAAAFAEAIQQNPGHIDNYLQLAELYGRRLDAPDQAQKVLDELVTENPRSAPALLARARWRESHAQLREAAEDVALATEIAPSNPAVHLAGAELSRRRGDSKEAQARLQRGFALAPNDPRLNEAAANLASQLGHDAEAIRFLRHGLKHAPDNASMLFQLAEALFVERADVEAAELRARLEKLAERPRGMEYLEGLLRMRRGEWVEAARILEKTRPLCVGAPWADRLELALASCYDHCGDLPRRLEACYRALQLNPGSVPARLELIVGLRLAGRNVEAIDEGRRLVRDGDVPPAAWLELARALIAWNGQQPLADRDPGEIDEICALVAKLNPGESAVTLLRADALASREAFGRAEEMLTQAEKEHPQDPSFAVARSALLASRKRWDEARKALTDAGGRMGDRAEARAARIRLEGQIATARKDAVPVRKALEELGSGLEKFSPEQRGQINREIATVAHRLGDLALALQAGRRWTEATPWDLSAWLSLFDVARLANDDAAMRAAVAGARRVEGDDGARWRCAEAWRSIERARGGAKEGLVEVERTLEEAVRLQPAWGRVWLLKAYLAEVQGSPERATTAYLRAFDGGEREPSAVRRLVELLDGQHRTVEADRVLQRFELEKGDLGPLARPAADIAFRVRDYRRAVELARRVIPPETRDYRDVLWLSRLLEEAGQTDEAGELLLQATQRFGAVPAVWVRRVQFLAAGGEKDLAVAALEEAKQRIPPGKADLALAQCYEALGQTAAAAARYRAALTAMPDDAIALHRAARFYLYEEEAAKARPILQALVAPDIGAPPEIAAWARRELALVLAREDPTSVDGSLTLLDKTARDGSVADRRARALVLGTRPDSHREALRLFEETVGRQPLTPEEQFRLAQLYDADNDRGKARELMLSLLANHPRDGRFLAGHVRSSLARDELTETRHWLAELEKCEPESRRFKALKEELASRQAKLAAEATRR